MPKEIWRSIPGFNKYEASNLGRIRNAKNLKLRKPKSDKLGYLYLNLTDDNGDVKTRFVHRLVAITYIPNPFNKPEIDHINTITNDNRVSNLRWVTHEENMKNEITMKKYKTVTIICNETGEVIKGLKETARRYNIDHSSLRKHLKGIPGYKSLKGHTFKKVED